MRTFPTAIWLLSLAACAGRAATPTTPASAEVRHLEELRIEPQPTENGYEFTAYDAESIFLEGVRLSRAGQCLDALPLYERVVREFSASRYAAPSHYNAALCFKEQGQFEAAVARFELLLRDYPRSDDIEHANFQLLELYVQLESFDAGQATAERLLAQADVTPDERVEAMARQAQLLLAAGEPHLAGRKAQETLAYARRRPADDEVVETYFLAAANFVLAETIRQQSEAIILPEGGVAVQRPILERRARLLLNAQNEYFDTMRHTHPHWAAAAGYQIGAMYDRFWTAITTAPVPPADPPLSGDDQTFYENEYHNALASLAKPLIRHAIRYWELTLVMVERTGVETEYTRQIRDDLEVARARLLEQPEGPGGIPGPNAPPAEPETATRLHYPSTGAI